MISNSLHLCVDGRYITQHYPGIGRVTQMLCLAWSKHPQVHRLDIMTNRRTMPNLAELQTAGNHVHLHPIDAPPFGVIEWWHMQQLMHQLAPDWIYAPYFLMPASRRPTKRLLTVHDAIPLEMTSMSLLRRSILAIGVRIGMARADCVTTVSRHAAQQIQRYYRYQDDITVIHNGVAEQFFVPPITTDLAVHGITQPFGLCVSSNQPHKNLDGLCAAWKTAYRTGKIPAQSQLVIAGYVDSHRSMPWRSAQYAGLPIIHLPNPADHVLQQLYHQAHMCLFPSLAEGFGLPIIEALAASNVVLCHDYPALRQLHGDVVSYTDMRQATQVADAIHRLWYPSAQRDKLIQHAQAHARTFMWSAVANQYIAQMQQR